MSPPLSVDEALERILDGVEPTAIEFASVEAAHRRTLAEPLAALLTQPPFDASAMDGYAVLAGDVARLPVSLAVIGTAAAGHPFAGDVAAGEAVRIFTGAPLPGGTDAIVIQENTVLEPAESGPTMVRVCEGHPDPGHVRRKGFDFRAGEILLGAGRRLGPRELSLAAAMGHGSLPLRRRPRVAILATGDELRLPGSRPGPGQIIASNHLGVAALAEAAGAQSRFIGIARDTVESLEEHFARADAADVIVTIGGASVGDHDLVGPALRARGMVLSFWKINMRPGKPLMFGRLGASCVLGLPGNPVSALVCARVFLVPLLRAMLGEPAHDPHPPAARLGVALEPNGPRQHYMRAITTPGSDGLSIVTPVRSQDSSLLAPLAQADCLIIRAPHAPLAPLGTLVPILPLDF
ncbi:MAG TPA: gephyrin-like molybdotransferase Glp [Hyphomicrobiaceae bacterium]|jgi:molybdopterin molybdotransferase